MMQSTISARHRTSLVATTLLGAAVLSSQVTVASADTDAASRNKQIVTDAFNRWTAGGTTFFTDLIAPDVVWTIEGSGPNAGVHRGRDSLMERAVRPLASRMAEPLKPQSVRVWADGDHVIVNWEGAGRVRDGQIYSNRYAWIMRMQDGRAAEVTAFLDLPRFDDVLQRIPDSPAK